MRAIAITPEVEQAIANGAAVVMNVSGGKDGEAAALLVNDYLESVGHPRDKRVLMHSDLGAVEWADSLPACERLAAHMGLPLEIVRRERGGMMERWEQRWADNVRRFAELECVKLIMPWSSPEWRFCTGELKTQILERRACQMFPGHTIVTVTGIRHDESNDRKNAPVSKEATGLERVKLRTRGLCWNPIVEFTAEDVFLTSRARGLAKHEAYDVFGAPRVSCVICIMGCEASHQAALRDPRNHEVIRRMVELELESSFAFQGNRWLADTARAVLLPGQLERVGLAKLKAERRAELDALVPEHLLYVKGWPVNMPTEREAEVLAYHRRQVADALGIEIKYREPAELLARYAELMARKQEKTMKTKSTKTAATKKTTAATEKANREALEKRLGRKVIDQGDTPALDALAKAAGFDSFEQAVQVTDPKRGRKKAALKPDSGAAALLADALADAGSGLEGGQVVTLGGDDITKLTDKQLTHREQVATKAAKIHQKRGEALPAALAATIKAIDAERERRAEFDAAAEAKGKADAQATDEKAAASGKAADREAAKFRAFLRACKDAHMAQSTREQWEEWGKPANCEEWLAAINPPKKGAATKGGEQAATKGAAKKAARKSSGEPKPKREAGKLTPFQQAMFDRAPKLTAKEFEGLNAHQKQALTLLVKNGLLTHQGEHKYSHAK